MRIISGRLKGHKLMRFKAEHIRPTTDRVKESIFNKLAPYIDGARVLDLYSGTGNLSFEAYSRGCEDITAVELSKKSAQIIKNNIKHLKVDGAIKLVVKDVFSYLKGYSGSGFEIILVDPPFTKKLADETMKELANSKVTNSDSIVVIESGKHEVIKDGYESLVLWDRKNLGDKLLSFYIKDDK